MLVRLGANVSNVNDAIIDRVSSAAAASARFDSGLAAVSPIGPAVHPSPDVNKPGAIVRIMRHLCYSSLHQFCLLCCTLEVNGVSPPLSRQPTESSPSSPVLGVHSLLLRPSVDPPCVFSSADFPIIAILSAYLRRREA